MKISRDDTGRTVRRFMVLAGGVWLCQAGGCVIDETLTNQILNLVVQALLGGLSGTTI